MVPCLWDSLSASFHDSVECPKKIPGGFRAWSRGEGRSSWQPRLPPLLSSGQRTDVARGWGSGGVGWRGPRQTFGQCGGQSGTVCWKVHDFCHGSVTQSPDTKAHGWGWALPGRGGGSLLSPLTCLRECRHLRCLGHCPETLRAPNPGSRPWKYTDSGKNSFVSFAAFGGKRILLPERPFCSVEHRDHVDHWLVKGQEAAGLQ